MQRHHLSIIISSRRHWRIGHEGSGSRLISGPLEKSPPQLATMEAALEPGQPVLNEIIIKLCYRHTHLVELLLVLVLLELL
ncbi:hypothetical protein GEV33_006491 [Tenebrio molitor]|uniref:Uncharacterized protein n=1 Tax=Tenebrio molitor TaxID=7067 RepID=A0A8J6HKI1_TENMO|nr:hypothetical protein GEV33_006491 [Tenebrio molitor]